MGAEVLAEGYSMRWAPQYKGRVIKSLLTSRKYADKRLSNTAAVKNAPDVGLLVNHLHDAVLKALDENLRGEVNANMSRVEADVPVVGINLNSI